MVAQCRQLALHVVLLWVCISAQHSINVACCHPHSWQDFKNVGAKSWQECCQKCRDYPSCGAWVSSCWGLRRTIWLDCCF